MKVALDFKASDLRGSLKGLALDSKAKSAMRQALLEVHKDIREGVAARYRGRRPEGSIDVQQSGNKLVGTITYVHRPTNLAEAVVAHRWGNIEPLPKRRPGRLAIVQVLREGGSKVVHGKYGYGGFVPRSLEMSKRAYMLERTSRYKYPVKQVWMLSEAQRAGVVLRRLKPEGSFLSKFMSHYGKLN